MSSLYLGLLIFSFLITGVLVVPFINLLYKIKFTRKIQNTKDAQGNRTKIFDKFHNIKAGTPVGGGFLIILVTLFLYVLLFPLVSYMGANVTAAKIRPNV